MNFEARPRSIKLRYRLLLGFITISLFILIIRSYELAYLNPFSSYSRQERIHRGTIFDSQGHELAVTEYKIDIGIRPKQLKKKAEAAEFLSRLTGFSNEEILKKIQVNINKTFFYLYRKIPKHSIKIENFSGVDIFKRPTRKYPNQNLASTVIGYVGDSNAGFHGIEHTFGDELSESYFSATEGNNIHLSLHPLIQYNLRKHLSATAISSKSKLATGLVIQSNSGRILAMSSLPDFDPNEWKKSNSRINHNIQSMYEPGSTFKMFSIASVIENDLLEENKTYFCPGNFEYKGKKQNCHGIHGEVNIRRAFQLSCNTGIIHSLWNLNVPQFYQQLRLFGFGTKTGVDLNGEIKGKLYKPQNWDIYRKMSVPIGHGVGVTPLQIAMAANTIANDGILLKPIIVDKITSPEGQLISEYEVKPIRRAISKQTAQKMRELLKDAVSPEATGKLADPQIPGLSICGKTGTSIKYVNNEYRKGKYQASFIGFVPCEKSLITILILFDEPQGEKTSGGKLAAPTFSAFLRSIIPFLKKEEKLKIQRLADLPYEKLKFAKGIMPNLVGKSKKEVLYILGRYFQGNHKITGSGYAISQQPAAREKINRPYQFSVQFGF